MKPPSIKRFLPRSLFGRAALILMVPVVTIQLVVSVMFLQRHFEGVTRQMTYNIAIEIAYLLQRVDSAPDLLTARVRAATLAGALDMHVTLPASSPRGEHRVFYDVSGRQMMTTLHKRLHDVLGIDLTSDSRAVRLLLDTRWGPMRVAFSRYRVSASNPHQLLVLMIFASALMTLIAYLFLRNQLRPITRLAAAAEAFGKGRIVAYRPRGAIEVRAAGRAFLDMRARIERQIEQRTLMLSGVSHDLRTPLTRLKLGLSMLDDEAEAAELRRDVDDMERLIDAFLSFARGDGQEVPEPTDIKALVGRVVENARRAGQDVTLIEDGAPSGPQDGHRGQEGVPPGRARMDAQMGPQTGPQTEAQVMLRPQAVTRAIENLVANAVRYGKRAEVRLRLAGNTLAVTVEDDGPGIPAARRDEALRPFTRLDAARNQDLGGGVGLGLTIAADVARSHGGRLTLGDSALGGLKAELTLAR